MLVFVYNPNTLQIERYERALDQPMPHVPSGSLTVGEFRGSSRTSLLYTDLRTLQTWNSFRSYYGRPIPVGYCFKRIWEGGHGQQSQHYAGAAFDVGQSLPANQRNQLYNAAVSFGGWVYVEPQYLTPTWVHFDKRLLPPACSSGGYITLRQGSRGVYVLVLQDALNALGYTTGGLDGIFGPATYNALAGFQQDNRLTVDGVCGCNSWRAVTAQAVGVGQTPTVLLP